MPGVPLPGRPVRGSRTGRPLMAALDLLGRRWALRVLWELRDGPVGFRELQQRCDDMSSSVLRDRLAELGEAGLVGSGEDGRYLLTASGSSLGRALAPLAGWARAWAAELEAGTDAAGPRARGSRPRPTGTDCSGQDAPASRHRPHGGS
jgi:DNA-binding HxlR family transcriptional regulator